MKRLCTRVADFSLRFGNSKGADQPAYSRSLMGAFVIPFMKIILPDIATRINCILLGSLCSRVGWFEYDLVGNIKYTFSSVEANLEREFSFFFISEFEKMMKTHTTT